MSLISDALKAAQDARSAAPQASARTASARRVLTPPVRARTASRAMPDARQLGGAVAAFVLALMIAAAVVISSPDVDRMADGVVPPAARTAANPLLPQQHAAASDLTPDRAHSGDGFDSGAGRRGTAGAVGSGAEESGAEESGAAGARAGRSGSEESEAAGRTGAASGWYASSPGEPVAREREPEDAAAANPAIPAVAAPRGGGRQPDERSPGNADDEAPDRTAGSPGFELRLGAAVPEAPRLFAEARDAQDRRDHRRARTLYERALEDDSNNAEALNNLGTVHQALGDPASAGQAFRRAIDVNPTYAAAWSNLGVALAALGEPAKARAALTEAIRLDPRNQGARVNLALEYQKQGLNGEARRLLERVIAASPEMPEAHYALARVLEQDGDRETAIRHYRRFLSSGADRFPDLAPPVRQRIVELGG